MMVLVHGWYCQQLSQEYQPFILDRMEFLGAFHRAVLSPRSFASVQTCAESEAPILILMSELFFWTYIKFVYIYIYIDDQLCIFTPTHHYLSIYLYIIYIYTHVITVCIYTYIYMHIYIYTFQHAHLSPLDPSEDLSGTGLKRRATPPRPVVSMPSSTWRCWRSSPVMYHI